MMEATASQTVLHNTIYKRKKRLPLSAHDRRKPLYQAVYAMLPTGNRARTAYLHCIKDGTNIDPACGTAGFLISSYKHILEKNKNKDGISTLSADERKRMTESFAGYDISPDMVRLSRVNMYLHKFSKPQINEYDTLSSLEKWDETYDVILANPPFMTPKGGIIPHNRYRIPAKRAEVLFVDYIAEHLNPTGRAGIIVPEGIVFQSANAYKALRKYLVDDDLLYAVISLPAGVFNPYSGVKTSILLFDRTLAKQKEEILFVKINNDGYDLGAQRRDVKGSDIPEAVKIIKGYQNGIDVSDNALVTVASKKDIAEQDYILVGERYKEAISYNNEYKIVNLEDVSSLITCGVAARPEYVESGIPFLSSQNVKNGNVVWKNYKYISLEDHNKLTKYNKPEKDDVLYTRVGSFGEAAVVDADIEFSIFVSLTLIKPLKNILNPHYLKNMLNSDKIKERAKNSTTGIGVQNLNVSTVRKFEIPLPPLHIQEEIVKEIEGYQKIIDGAKQVVENYKPTIKIDPSWEMVKLGDVCDIGSSKRIFQGEYVDNGIPFFRTKEIVELSNGNDITNELFISIKRYQEIKSKFDVPKKGDILISAVGTIGISWVVKDNREFYFKDGNLIWIKSSDVLNPSFLKYMLDIFVRDNKNSLTNGVAYNALTIIKLKEVKIPIPSVDEQQGIIRKIDDEISIIEQSKRLIRIFEQKIKDKIAEVWGEDSK